jgi:hypothetical protein
LTISRLTLQHQILKEIYGNRILLAPVHLDVNDAVLEIGTGTGELLSHTKGDNAHRPTFLQGLWIMDLAKSVNTSIPMFAIDIESRMFPVSPPKQIEFRVESTTCLPAEWANTFSLVHQRLLMAGLQRSDWRSCWAKFTVCFGPEVGCSWVKALPGEENILEGLAWRNSPPWFEAYALPAI